MIFISAGHHSKKTTGADPGAIGVGGQKEGDLTIEFRDLVCAELTKLGAKFIKDSDEETLQQYVNRVQTGDGSVVVEYHFNAATPQATGTETLIEVDGDRLDKAFAKELSDSTSAILGIKNRGILSEAQTRHKRLALMTEKGIVGLHEIAFITNADDMSKYHANKLKLAEAHAKIIVKYEQIIP